MKYTFKNKLFIKISVIFICLIIISSAIFFGYAYNTLRSDSLNNLNNISQRTAGEIDNLISNMDSLALNISTDKQVRDYYASAATAHTPIPHEVADVLISAMIPRSASKFRISLYNRAGNFISAGLAYNQNVAGKLLNSPDYLNWYDSRKILYQNGALLEVTKDFWSSGATATITLCRNIYHISHTSRPIGIVEIQCPIDYITKRLSATSDNYDYTLCDATGKKICGSHTYDNTWKTKALLAHVVLESGWTLTGACPMSYVFRLLFSMLLFILILCAVIIAVSLLVINRTLKTVTKPLTLLTDKVQNITLNQPGLRLSFSGYPDEFGQLNEAFAQMMERLQVYMEENIKRKAYEMQANMIALQSQINPHFLYNILTAIKSHALEENYEQIAPACNYLAEMLRYISVYSEESVPLSIELNHAILYLRLMKIRYEDCFSYSIQIEENMDLSKVLIPRLSIQPMLENCFQHGFKKMLPIWEIRINCRSEESTCVIEIIDNGSGFSREGIVCLQMKINDFLTEPSVSLPSLTIGGMGLINTIVRMTLKYHERFGYQIDSPAWGHHGTKITFTIKEDYNNEYSAGRR